MQRIGLVVHGPEIIDSGCARSLINYLKGLGSVFAVLGGTMGRVAVIDAGLEDAITITPRRSPSESIRDLQDSSDVIFLLNQAKSRVSGLVFCTMVAAAAGTEKPLIAIDCGGRFVIVLSKDDGGLAERIACDLGLDLLPTPLLPGASLGEKNTIRAISAVIPGELVSINGIVIGRATESHVEIKTECGRIVGLKGIKPKEHGLEKLSSAKIDLGKAIIRSGSIRRSDGPKARFGEIAIKKANSRQEEWVAIIDHCAEDSFEAALGASLAVTVGDDTTIIAGDILARVGIPVIGIVDGDPDRLTSCTSMLPGSIIFRVMPGYDDLLGRRIKAEIFLGKRQIGIRADEMTKRIKTLALASGKLVEIENVSSE
ncbi:MAG: hypothetical protein A4E49_00504 [Methanosaeta sp. PtaU1.Bin112]|nr:MAG: hypothetical protein A4E49_00504 [Methanosaeta sp. PtaU1.Bin112]